MKELFEKFISEWWGIILIVIVVVAICILLSALFYRSFFKRFYDILLSGLALIGLSPVLLILTVLGAIKMKGNPFFMQLRPGKVNKKTGEEKIFKLIKFRTMTCERDKDGVLLPDEKRLTKYGLFLRRTSLDELPELMCVFIGTMSFIGPRPLLVNYLPYYTEEERHRHDIRPGLTGLAQVSGRNNVEWSKRFQLDLQYVKNISLINDIKIIFLTIKKVLVKSDVSEDTSKSEGNFAEIRIKEQEKNKDIKI